MPAAGSTSTLNEAQARYVLIDPALDEAGWKVHDRTQVGLEVPVDGYDAKPWNGVTDCNSWTVQNEHAKQNRIDRADVQPDCGLHKNLTVSALSA